MQHGTPKGIIFDKDGTLYDYPTIGAPILKGALHEVFIRNGISDKAVEDRLFRMLGFDENCHPIPNGVLFRHSKINIFLRALSFCIRSCMSPAKFARMAKEVTELNSESAVRKLKEMDTSALISIFSDLRSRDIRIGIVTNDFRSLTEEYLEALGIREMVDMIFCKDDDVRRKPSPQAIRKFCREYGLEPSELAVVGDSMNDVRFGLKGKVGHIAAIASNENDERRFSRYADIIYSNIEDIRKDEKIFPSK